MFFRRKHSPSGHCLQLLEAYRTVQGQPRQRVVVSLGGADVPTSEQAAIAQAVAARLYGQEELALREYSPAARQWIDQIIKRVDREGRWQPAPLTGAASPSDPAAEVIDGVLAEQVSHTHTTALGPSWVGWQAWNQLGLSEALAEWGWNQAQQAAAAITTIHRLVAPGSERALLAWLPDSSLPEVLGRNLTAWGKDRFYRISDQLLGVRARLEAHLRERTQSLFNLDRRILLYDLTNSYFEGQALANPQAQRGKSKEKRDDCPPIVLGMVFDREGFELAHRVFEGNQSDGKSLVKMVSELEQLLPPATGGHPPLVIVDGGVATRANLKLLREKKFGYLVNQTRQCRGRYRSYFKEDSQFTPIGGREGKPAVRVRLLADPEFKAPEQAPDAGLEKSAPALADQLVLCKSQGRLEKEQAICSVAETGYVAALERLSQRVAKGKLREPEKIHRALGRLQGRYPRVQRFYRISLREEPAAAPDAQPPGRRLEWQRWEADYQEHEELFGCYVLRTDRRDLSADALWQLYITLTRAEEGFRALKGELGLRPNYHQVERRVEGHVWISVLAYQLLRYVLRRLEAGQEYRSWTTLKRILSTHCYTTVLLPTKAAKLYRIRKAGEPEEEQKRIYRLLGMEWKQLPKTRTILTANAATTL